MFYFDTECKADVARHLWQLETALSVVLRVQWCCLHEFGLCGFARHGRVQDFRFARCSHVCCAAPTSRLSITLNVGAPETCDIIFASPARIVNILGPSLTDRRELLRWTGSVWHR